MKALHDLVESGKVRYIGACSMRCWKFSHLNKVASKNGWTKFVSVQDEYPLLYRKEVRSPFMGHRLSCLLVTLLISSWQEGEMLSYDDW